MTERKDVQKKEYAVDLELETKENLKLSNIFKGSNAEHINRVLIEALPGYGKTALATKLVLDWANDVDYMKQFELVFYIPLKAIEGYNVTSCIEEICKEVNFSDKKAIKLSLQESSEKTLIIMDGFDELPEGDSRDSVLDVLFKQTFPSATVVLTCRSGSYKKIIAKSQKLKSRRKKFWNRKVTILGVSEEEVDNLVNLLAPQNKINAKNFVAGIQGRILRSPIVAMMIDFLHGKGELKKLDETMTKFYKEMFNGLVRYNSTKLDVNRDKKSDLFSSCLTEIRPADHSTDVCSLFHRFGKLCFNLLNENKFQLEESEDVTEMYNIGFLTKIYSDRLFNEYTQYETLHGSFQEFFVAFYLSQAIVQAGHNPLDRILLETLTRLFSNEDSMSLIPQFLVDLLEDKLHLLFRQLYLKKVKILTEITSKCIGKKVSSYILLCILPVKFNENYFSKLIKWKRNSYISKKDLRMKTISKNKVTTMILYNHKDYFNLGLLEFLEDVEYFNAVKISSGRSDNEESTPMRIGVIYKFSCSAFNTKFPTVSNINILLGFVITFTICLYAIYKCKKRDKIRELDRYEISSCNVVVYRNTFTNGVITITKTLALIRGQIRRIEE